MMRSGFWLIPVTLLLAFLFIASGCQQQVMSGTARQQNESMAKKIYV
jgi:hypothetical protein